MPRPAFHRLNAPQREHEPPGRGHKIRPHAQRPRHLIRRHQFPRRQNPDPLRQPVLGPQRRHHRQRLGNRQPDIIRQRRRRRPGPTLAAIHMHIIRRPFRMLRNLVKPLIDKIRVAHDEFYPHRLARHLPHMRHKRPQFGNTPDIPMPIRAYTILSLRNPANLRDLLRHLIPRQYPALPRLRPLRQLHLKHFDLAVSRDRPQPVIRKRPIRIAHAILRGADLHHDIPAPLQMKFRQPALARPHPDAGKLRPARQRGHRRMAQRAITHPRNIEKMHRHERLPARPRPRRHANQLARKRPLLLIQHRKSRIAKHKTRHVLRAKTHQVRNPFCRPVNPTPLQPVERPLRPVRQILVLPHILAPGLGKIPHMPDHREIPQNRMLRLMRIMPIHRRHRRQQNQHHQGENHFRTLPFRLPRAIPSSAKPPLPPL